MWLLYWKINGVQGWRKAKTQEALMEWLEENFNLATLTCEDYYDFADLNSTVLKAELKEANDTLKAIKRMLG